jgi:hypothetical protein
MLLLSPMLLFVLASVCYFLSAAFSRCCIDPLFTLPLNEKRDQPCSKKKYISLQFIYNMPPSVLDNYEKMFVYSSSYYLDLA